MRLPLVAALVLTASPSIAAPWVAEMMEDEGGPRMMAMVEGVGGDVPPSLFLMCADAGNLNLRYSMGSGPAEGADITGEFAFVFDFAPGSATLDMVYEEMDGAYAGYFPITDPVVGLLKSGANVTVSDPTGTYQAVPFTLDGASKAVDTVIKACE